MNFEKAPTAIFKLQRKDYLLVYSKTGAYYSIKPVSILLKNIQIKMTIYNDENKYFDMQLTSWNKSLYIYKYINPFKMAKIRLSTNFSDSPRIYFIRYKGF